MNDNNPEFNQTDYSLFANSDSYIGERIAIVTATDADSGLNEVLSYELEGSDASFFSIHAETGEIYTASVLDRPIGMYASYSNMS